MPSAIELGLLSAALACVSLLALKPLAPVVGLMDRPGARKHHQGLVPLIGGVSAFLGLALAWFLLMPLSQGYGVFWLCSLALVLVGAADDALDISARIRLVVQVVLGGLLVMYSGVYITHFGDLVGHGVVELGWLGPFVTIAAIIGATNAYNMLDGIDGLAGSLSLVTLAGLVLLYVPAGLGLEVALSVGLALALMPGMMANLKIRPWRRKVFMGDAGAMFIGFAVVWLLAKGVDPEAGAMRPVTALWLVAVPLMDMVAIMLRRLSRGQSVMMADRDHLHHIFMRAGFSDREALVIISGIAVLLATIGLLGEYFYVPEALMLALFLTLFTLYERALNNVWRLLVKFRRSGVLGCGEGKPGHRSHK